MSLDIGVEPGHRSGWSYLLAPRVKDGLIKCTFIPIAYVVVRFSHDGSAVPLGSALLAWLSFEACFYQGRYALNDLLDRDLDAVHPAHRGIFARMPAAVSKRSVILMLLVRAGAAAAALAIADGRARRDVVVAIAASILASAVYERLRSRSGRQAASSDLRTIRAIWLMVGAGYAIRLSLGAALGGASPALLAVAALAGWMFGMMFVMQAWTLEAAGLAACGAYQVLERKPHVSALASTSASRRPLLHGAAARRTAAIASIAVLLAGLLGHGLAQPPSLRLFGATAALTLLAVVACWRVRGGRWPWGAFAVATVVAAVIPAVGGGQSLAMREIPVAVFAITAMVFAASDPSLVGFTSPQADTES